MHTQARKRERSFTGALLHQLLKDCFVICSRDPALRNRSAQQSPVAEEMGVRSCVFEEASEPIFAAWPAVVELLVCFMGKLRALWEMG